MPRAGRVALVSGGSRGLGAELVSGFLERQYWVATLSRTKTPFITNMLRAGKRRNSHWSAVDGRDHEALRAFVKKVGERLGRIDVLVNNAGIATEGILPIMRTRDIVEAIDVNLAAKFGHLRIVDRQVDRRLAAVLFDYGKLEIVGERVPRDLAAGLEAEAEQALTSPAQSADGLVALRIR